MSNKKEVVIYTYKFKQKSNRKLTLLDGQVVQGGSQFQAPAEAIPKGFKDLVEIIADSKKMTKAVIVNDKALIKREEIVTLREKEVEEKAVELAEKEEELLAKEEALKEREEALTLVTEETEEGKEPKEEKSVYTLKHITRGKWNILNAEGEPVLEENVTKTVAEEELETLTK